MKLIVNSIFFNILRFKLNDTMEIASNLAPLSKCFASLFLHTKFTLSDIEKLWKGTIDVLYNFFPAFDMKGRVAFRNLSNNNPSIKFADIFVLFICIHWLCRSPIKTNWAEIMVLFISIFAQLSPFRLCRYTIFLSFSIHWQLIYLWKFYFLFFPHIVIC